MFALSELVDTDDSGARPAISPTACHGRTTDSMCAVECYSRNLVDQVAAVQEIGGGCTGQMVACLLLEKVGSPQPSSLIGTPKESFFVEQFFSPADQSSLVYLGPSCAEAACIKD